MRVSAGSLKNFEEWIQMYEASMNERVYKSLESSRDGGAAKPSKTDFYVIDGLLSGCQATVPRRQAGMRTRCDLGLDF